MTAWSRPDEAIRTVAQPTCPVCGGGGVVLYDDLTDRIFGAPGVWRMKRCATPNCGVVWLDPLPTVADLPKAYLTYYTHPDRGATTARAVLRGGLLAAIYGRAKDGYLAGRYGYHGTRPPAPSRMLGALLRCFPGRREALDVRLMYLRAKPRGRLLDVGCGDGRFLETMRDLGWSVEGVDVDPAAVAATRRRGLTVRLGGLADQRYPESSFDAVTLRHVLEHVANPLPLLRECRRILAPGGRLVVLTPNTRSWGHRLFREDWRGLEPPRHLVLFNAAALRRVAVTADLAPEMIRTTRRASYVLAASCALRTGVPIPNGAPRLGPLPTLMIRLLAAAESIAAPLFANAGEELLMICSGRQPTPGRTGR